jgi:hypothetical protein
MAERYKFVIIDPSRVHKERGHGGGRGLDSAHVRTVCRYSAPAAVARSLNFGLLNLKLMFQTVCGLGGLKLAKFQKLCVCLKPVQFYLQPHIKFI